MQPGEPFRQRSAAAQSASDRVAGAEISVGAQRFHPLFPNRHRLIPDFPLFSPAKG
jgi:hypothetical protein